MKKLALALALTAASVPAFAQAAKSDWSFTGNAGLFSDYRFRGYTQTNYKPAFQGGFDLAHSSGFYVGNWNSNVEQALFTGASLEMDLYGGYKTTINGVGYDIGYLYYYYPDSGRAGSTKIKNGELYLGGSYGPVALKWYYATTKFFSIGEGTPVDTKGSWYLDLTGNFDLGTGWGFVAHYGYQKIKDLKVLGAEKDNYSDYKLGITKDLSGWVVGASLVATSDKDFFATGEGKDAGKTRLVASLSKSF